LSCAAGLDQHHGLDALDGNGPAPGFVARDAVWKTPTSGRIDYMRLKRGQSQTD
jgi:hypothetical protein